MQFFILFIGAMVFVFYLFAQPPLLFHPVEMKRVEAAPEYSALEARHQRAFNQRMTAARHIKDAHDPAGRAAAVSEFRDAQSAMDSAHSDALKLSNENDTNYIFLSFVTRYFPHGVIGLVLGVIFTAAMSAISGEINSLATVTVIDIYRRHFRPDALDRHYLLASRVATVFWGIYAIAFASIFARGFGALIEAVNQVGSYFYGGMLGVFVLAFFVKRVRGSAAFFGVLAGEAAIVLAANFTSIAYLWFNVVGCLVVIAVALAISYATEPKPTLGN